jgi:predicted MPP superfamily phosphohydrolase
MKLYASVMSDPDLITILHISDFHFTKRKHREQEIVVNALVADLAHLCIGHRRPDMIVFTGDLVQAAGVDSHDDAYDFVIGPVVKATGCSDERVFIVPGNHDLSWKSLETSEVAHKDWRSQIGQSFEADGLNARFEGKQFDQPIADKFHDFFELESYLRGDEQLKARRLKNAFVSVDHIEPLNIDFVSFNTAGLSAGGNKHFAPDEGHLAIPEYASLEAVKALNPGSLRVFATHHPLSWLSELSAKQLGGVIQEHGDLHLFGHMHDPQPQSIVGLKGKILADQAGAIFTARGGAYIGYSLITTDRLANFSETHLRTYYDERKQFDEATDLIPGGVWYPSPEARQHFRKIAKPVDDAELRQHLSGIALNALKLEESEAGGEGVVHEKFVAPPMQRTFIQNPSGNEIKAQIETPVAFADVVAGDGNIILYAHAEYGRTTLLRELRYQLLVSADDVGFPRLPILVDFSDISSNADNMLRVAKARASEPPNGHDVESLLKLGHVCVLIDDVIFSDVKRSTIIRRFVERFPKARYVLSSPKSSAAPFGTHVVPEMAVHFDFIEVREFRRRDMRQLLTKFDRCDDVEVWLDRLQAEFREINLPFTAANGSILMEILQEKHNFTAVNRSVLIEQFVDATLSKAALEQSRRETFDYKNKTAMLAHVAAWMAAADDYIPLKEGVRAEMRGYLDRLGLNASVDELMNEFLLARIFVARPDDRISFRYRAVLEYFIALQMTTDTAFKSWVMDEGRYLQFVNEIQYYAGKLRNDAALVAEIGTRFQKLMAIAEEHEGPVDLHQLTRLELPTDATADAGDKLAEQLAAAPLTKEEKDAELEGELPRDVGERQEVFRPKVEEPGHQIFLSLILYSGVVKNMELIEDAQKRIHLSTLWNGWSIYLYHSLRIVPKLAKDRRVRLNGVLYEIMAPHGMSDADLARTILLRMPTAHVKLLSGALGTEKLEKQLTEPQFDEKDDPLVYSLLKAGLAAELRLKSATGVVNSALVTLKDSPYLLEALITNIVELRRVDRLRNDDMQKLEMPLANAIANLRGGDHKSKEGEKRRQLTRLGKERLLLEMKRSQEE